MKNQELSDIRTVIEILNKEANIVRLSIIDNKDVLEMQNLLNIERISNDLESKFFEIAKKGI
jgi:hypothetical protein|tara:strand:+ start:2387 stop:2572 length:186 start_codon:yes stop_codon:yes gene_type:complete